MGHETLLPVTRTRTADDASGPQLLVYGPGCPGWSRPLEVRGSATGRRQHLAPRRLVHEQVLEGVGPCLRRHREQPAGPPRRRPPGWPVCPTPPRVPWLMASSTGSPNPSCRLGKANTAAPPYSDHSSRSPTRPSWCMAEPRAAGVGGRQQIPVEPARVAGEDQLDVARERPDRRRIRPWPPPGCPRPCAVRGFRPRGRTAARPGPAPPGRRAGRPGSTLGPRRWAPPGSGRPGWRVGHDLVGRGRRSR